MLRKFSRKTKTKTRLERRSVSTSATTNILYVRKLQLSTMLALIRVSLIDDLKDCNDLKECDDLENDHVLRLKI